MKHKNGIGCKLNIKRLFIKNEWRYLCVYVVSLALVVSDIICFSFRFLKRLVIGEMGRNLNGTQQMG